MEAIASTKILGINVSTEKRGNILKNIIRRLRVGKKFYIVTPNPEIMMYALKDKEYRHVLDQAQFAIPDGVGVLMASKILKKGVLERITGVDFMMEVVRECAREGLTTGFLGGGSGIAEGVADCLKKIHPKLKIGFTGEEWDEKKMASGGWQVAGGSALKHIDMLFVAFGFPKQEKWIADNLDKIPVTAAMGVGGSFDFITGKVKRAPSILRRIGLEWLYRVSVQPWRVKRQLALPQFAYYVIRERLFGEKSMD